MFALATLEVNADNLADHVLALEALDSYRYIALLDFVVKMTTHIQATQLVVSAEGEDLNAKMEIGWNILSKNLQDLKKSLASETDEHEMSVIDDLIEISSDLVKFEVYLSKIAELLKLQTVIPIPDILSALQVTREHMQKKLRFS